MISLEDRLAEIDRLTARGARRDVQALTELLGDEEWQTRRAAALALATVVPALSDVESRDRAITELLRAIGSPADAPRRAAAIVALEAIGRMALPHLAVALAGAPASTRTALAGVIGGAGGAGAVGLLEPLTQESDQNVVAASILALGRTRSAEALPLLLARLDGTDEWLKFAAIGALGELGDGRAVGRLAELIEDPLLRESAIASLVEIGTVDAARELGKRVFGGINGELKTDALTALVSVVAHSRTQPPAIAGAIYQTARHALPPDAGESLLTALDDLLPSGEIGVINACLTALGWLVEPGVLRLVDQLFRDCAFTPTVRDVLIALAGTDRGVHDIFALTPDQLPALEAALILAEVRSLAALEASVRLLIDARDEETIQGGLTALTVNANWLANSGQVVQLEAGERIVELLRARLALDGPKPSTEVARALGLFAKQWTRERILAASQELTADTGEAGVLASLTFLSQCDSPLAAAGARRALKHPSARVRVFAIETIARHSENPSGVGLAAQLTDESAAVRRAAARSQRWLASGDDIQRALAASLSDDDVWVRVEAIGSLAILAGNDHEVAGRLGEELFSGHPLCRVAAIEAQRSLTSPDWVKLQDLARRDKHAEVRTAALRVLAGHPQRLAISSQLERALVDADWAVRFTAIDLAMIIDHRDMAERLPQIAGDAAEVAAVRALAIRALANWSHPAAVRIAVAALDDPALTVSEAAFDALGRLRRERTAELEAHYLNCSPRAANHIHFILQTEHEVMTDGVILAATAHRLDSPEQV